ncbi:ABC transporter permease [Brenneria tiliae]|uniref:ABC transporter permease n=1 Tax=Brenneria tiliae TaxID=2914984 RepID=UPI002014973C|nr:ABC transporter permease [Brenneria tiliae]MCL2898410.1 ABC transporter permease [Brenneria tiliae]MCL2903048.1 ABC transporter permease [Brenneria tiliae]
MGRDIFSRTLWGTRPTFFIVFTVLAVTGPLGIVIGAAAGLFGGFLDRLLMRICDIFMAFPRLILSLAIAAALGAGIGTVILAVSLTAWTPYARVARAETVTFRQSEFIQAARMLGASSFQLLWRHIMPLCVPSMIVRMALDVPGIILVISGLGFLGAGIRPPAPEWGAIVADGRSVIFEAFWVSTFPGLAILTAGLAFNILGDALRDLLAPGDE